MKALLFTLISIFAVSTFASAPQCVLGSSQMMAEETVALPDGSVLILNAHFVLGGVKHFPILSVRGQLTSPEGVCKLLGFNGHSGVFETKDGCEYGAEEVGFLVDPAGKIGSMQKLATTCTYNSVVNKVSCIN